MLMSMFFDIKKKNWFDSLVWQFSLISLLMQYVHFYIT